MIIEARFSETQQECVLAATGLTKLRPAAESSRDYPVCGIPGTLFSNYRIDG